MTVEGGRITTPALIHRLILPVLLWLALWLLSVPLPAQEATPQAQLQLQQGSGRLYDLALSSDRAVLAAAGDDNTVHLWDPVSGERIRVLSAPRQGANDPNRPLVALPADYVSSVAFHPTSRLLAAAGTDRMIRLWDYTLGTLVYTLSGHTGPVRAMVFHPQGGVLASAGEDGTIRLWNANNGERLGLLRAHEGTIHALAFSRNGNVLASAGEDGMVRLWDFASGQLLRTLSGHQGRVATVAFHPLDDTLASGGQDGTIRLWQPDTGALIRVLEGHQDAVTDLAFQPRQGRLASVGLEGRLLLWQLPAGTRSEPIPLQDNPLSAVEMADESTVITAGLDGVARLWNLTTGQPRLVLALLPDGEWLAYDPVNLYYNTSPRGDQFATLRFTGLEQTLFPLHYYNLELFQPGRLDGLGRNPVPVAGPDLEPRLWRLRWERLDIRLVALALAVLTVLAGLMVAGVVLLGRRRQLLPIARRCLTEAGFERIRSLGTGLQARRDEETVLLLPWSPALAAGEPPASLTGPLERAAIVYLVHDRSFQDLPPPTAGQLDRLAGHTRGARLVPLWYPRMAVALARGTPHDLFDELERFHRQRDPYILPPQSLLAAGGFVGRERLLETLPPLLAQGRHVGLFGLRHMGKSALSRQLAHQLPQPTVLVLCQELTVCAEAAYMDILGQFRALLTARGMRRLPKLPMAPEPERFEQLFMDLYRRACKRGLQTPVVVMLDGIDRFMPGIRMPGYEAVLAEYTQLLRTLTHLARTHQALVLLVSGERPEASRRTNLSTLAGENPLHQALQEIHLGPLEAEATASLIRRPGALKGIVWQEGTVERLHELSGGHPWISARLASEFCRQGRQTEVTLADLEQRLGELLTGLEEHEIGIYFREAVWNILGQDERHLAGQILRAGSRGLPTAALMPAQNQPLAILEELGLVERRQAQLLLRSGLFHQWLEGHTGQGPAIEYRNPLL